MYNDYKFHVCIENFSTPHYFSEKIINPLRCNTTPIYWGCKNIHSYFDDAVINLTGDVGKDIEMLKLFSSAIFLTKVVLPAPDGDDNITTIPSLFKDILYLNI